MVCLSNTNALIDLIYVQKPLYNSPKFEAYCMCVCVKNCFSVCERNLEKKSKISKLTRKDYMIFVFSSTIDDVIKCDFNNSNPNILSKTKKRITLQYYYYKTQKQI